jgi:hypothetical protein
MRYVGPDCFRSEVESLFEVFIVHLFCETLYVFNVVLFHDGPYFLGLTRKTPESSDWFCHRGTYETESSTRSTNPLH